MPDYGHPLRFGSFITPVNQPAARAVGLSQLSEDLGLDLVTFQDHPYQAGLHDTWTLLSWVAAKTTRIQVSGNVLNLPLRQPAVLARSVASLDLLSGGRVSLGLGAGWAWDAIEAMGGRRLSIGQGVTALDEAIDVIRGLWDTTDQTPLRVAGAFYGVDGAARGPAPAHEVPIWVGAYKPRMQQLTGRKADGWVLGLPVLQPGDLTRGNSVIDHAALAAGRDPRDITRLLNVTAGDPAADLARLAVDDGVSVFILLSDDPADLRHFAERTVPEIRDRVGEARGRKGRAAAPHRTGPARPTRCGRRQSETIPCRRRWPPEPSGPETPTTRATPPATSAAGHPPWCCAQAHWPRCRTRCASPHATATCRWASSAAATACRGGP